jgi:hypothetical protein
MPITDIAFASTTGGSETVPDDVPVRPEPKPNQPDSAPVNPTPARVSFRRRAGPTRWASKAGTPASGADVCL